ncbi:MAG: electron transfer flavoprotein subunit alpha/FixB family protein [SAR324 cluster bacterium]|nr:electron transfer flavoprotein subunit alpha/FixB family protein [SAR324 cluster bacterium]
MILGIIEHDGVQLDPYGLQMLTFARDLSARLNTSLEAVLIGKSAESSGEQIKNFGISKVHLIQHERLEHYAPEAWAESVIQLLADKKADLAVAAGTERGNELMAHIAAKLDLPLASNCSEISHGDGLEITRLRWGGSLLEETSLRDNVKLLTLALNIVEAQESSANPVDFEAFTPTLEDKDFRVQLSGREENTAEGVTLKTASLVVGGGRGVGSAEGFKVLEELAECLGGVVGGSRVATNNGWRPHTQQVGLTGNRISPKLYIACGISGAIQHLVGCKAAKNILVINVDREAPFFSKADYGVLGDLHEVVPALISEIKKVQ